MTDNYSIICNKGHSMKKIKNNENALLCNICNSMSCKNFVSCFHCSYFLCFECQKEQIKEFEILKANQDCHLEEKYLKFVNSNIFNECSNSCGKESIGYIQCKCGIKFCLECYFELFPDNLNDFIKNNEENDFNYLSTKETNLYTSSGFDTENNNRDNSKFQCHHEIEWFKYKFDYIKDDCIGGCEKDGYGYFECVCFKKICVLCFQRLYPEYTGKYKYEKKMDCPHFKSDFVFVMGNSENFNCGYNCKRKSNGYMECVCGYNICASCFDELYSKNETIAFDSQSFSYITDNLLSEKKIINFSSKADIESVKTDEFNRKNKRCNNGHNMIYMKNLEENLCSYCKKEKKDNFLWTCYKCFEFSCESCSNQIKKKTEDECFCCIIF